MLLGSAGVLCNAVIGLARDEYSRNTLSQIAAQLEEADKIDAEHAGDDDYTSM